MVPGAGVEPARYFYRGILSPLRLPISPPGLIQDGLTILTHTVLMLVINDDSPPQRHVGI